MFPFYVVVNNFTKSLSTNYAMPFAAPDTAASIKVVKKALPTLRHFSPPSLSVLVGL